MEVNNLELPLRLILLLAFGKDTTFQKHIPTEIVSLKRLII
jgi:hypothetical protein